MQLTYYYRLWLKTALLTIAIGMYVSFLCRPVMADNVAAFGDSITEGIGSFSGGYPPKLQLLLNSYVNGTHTVDNHGKAGEATAWGNGRIHSVLGSKSYQYVLILEGTNDIFFGLSLSSTKYYLEAMIQKSRNLFHVTPLIALLTPDTRDTSPANKKNIETTYNPMIANLANQMKVPLVNLYSAVVGNWNALSDDQLHPNDVGYQIVANTWFHPLKALIDEEQRRQDEEQRRQNEEEDSGGGGGGGCFIDTIFQNYDDVK
jgi:lysophospholipase L1-like esterase